MALQIRGLIQIQDASIELSKIKDISSGKLLGRPEESSSNYDAENAAPSEISGEDIRRIAELHIDDNVQFSNLQASAVTAASATLAGDLNAANATLSGDLSAANATLSGDLNAANATLSADLSAVGGTFSGNISSVDATLSGDLSAASATLSGDLSSANATLSGDLSAANATLSADLSAANATLSGNIAAVDGTYSGDLSAVDATLSGDLVAVGGTFSGNIAAVDATMSGNIAAADTTLSGDLNAANATLSGDLSATGDVSGAAATFSGALSAGASTLGAISAPSAAIENAVTSGSIASNGILSSAGKATLNSLEVSNDADILGAAAITGAISANSATFASEGGESEWQEPVRYNNSLVASDAENNDFYGSGSALSNNGLVLAVGASMWDGEQPDQGGVYIYDWNSATEGWDQRGSVLNAPDAGNNDRFGESCSLNSDGTLLAVGAQMWDGSETDQGAAYVFEYSGGSWNQKGSTITHPDPAYFDLHTHVSLSDDGLVLSVGVYNKEISGDSAAGAVYVYDWDSLTEEWILRSYGSLDETTSLETDLVNQHNGSSNNGIYISSLEHLGNGIVLAGTYTSGSNSSGSSRIYRSTNNGQNWTIANTFSNINTVNVIKYLGDGVVLVGTNGGSGDGNVYRSTDHGQNWSIVSDISSHENIENLEYLGDGICIFGAGHGSGDGYIYRSTDHGATWSVTDGSNSIFANSKRIATFKYLGDGICMGSRMTNGGQFRLIRSTDYGATWSDIGQTTLLSDKSSSYPTIEHLGDGKVIVVATYTTSCVYCSTDYGQTFDTTPKFTVSEWALSMEYLGNGRVVLGTYSGNSSTETNSGNLYESTDYGQTWNSTAIFSPGVKRISNLRFNPETNTLLVGCKTNSDEPTVYILGDISAEVEVLLPSDSGASHFFGRDTSLNSDGSVLVIGAAGWDDDGVDSQGAVYTYDWDGTSWNQRGSVLETPTPAVDDFFGFSCQINSDATIMIVSKYQNGADFGEVELYDWNAGTSSWDYRTGIDNPVNASGNSTQFGYKVGINGDGTKLVVGSRQGNSGKGAIDTYSVSQSPSSVAGALEAGAATLASAVISGDISADNATFSGDLDGYNTTFSGTLSAGASTLASAAIAGAVSAGSFSSSSVNIDGGSIDGTAIGETSRSSGKFSIVDVTGSMTVGENLTVTGNTTTIDTDNLIIQDPMVQFGEGNASDDIDLGFVGVYSPDNLGYNLIKNGEFDSDLSEWTDLSSGVSGDRVWQASYNAGKLNLQTSFSFDGTAGALIYQRISFKPDTTGAKSYKVKFDVVNKQTMHGNTRLVLGFWTNSQTPNIQGNASLSYKEIYDNALTISEHESDAIIPDSSLSSGFTFSIGLYNNANFNMYPGAGEVQVDNVKLWEVDIASGEETEVIYGPAYAGLVRDADDSGIFKLFNTVEDLSSAQSVDFEVSSKSTLDADIKGNIQYDDAKEWSISGDIAASAVSYDGTGNVELSATIQSNSVEISMLDCIIDEDDMNSDSSSHIPTQSSVKAYADTQVSSGGLDNLSAKDIMMVDSTGSFIAVKQVIESIDIDASKANDNYVDLTVAADDEFDELSQVFLNGKKLRFSDDETNKEYYFSNDDSSEYKRLYILGDVIENEDRIEVLYFTKSAETTYTLTATPNTIEEGNIFTVTLDTVNVANGTQVSYSISGGLIDEDYTIGPAGAAADGGYFEISDNTASFTMDVISDALHGGDETVTIDLDNGLATLDIVIQNNPNND